MNTPIAISGTITEKDFVTFNFLAIRRRIGFFIWIFMITFFVASASSITTLLTAPSKTVSVIFKDWDFSMFMFLVLPAFMLIAIYFSAKKAYRKDTLIGKKRTYIFDAEGMSCTNENSNTRIDWSDTKQVVFSKNMILIYLTSRGSFPIPKHFMTEEENNKVRTFLKENIKSKKVGLRRFIPGTWVIVCVLVFIVLMSIPWGSSSNKSHEFYAEGRIQIDSGKYEAAIKLFDKAIKENPNYAFAYNLRGYAKGLMDNHTGELEDCSKAILLDTGYADAYLRVGYAKAALGDSTGACETFHNPHLLGYEGAKEAIKENCE